MLRQILFYFTIFTIAPLASAEPILMPRSAAPSTTTPSPTASPSASPSSWPSGTPYYPFGYQLVFDGAGCLPAGVAYTSNIVASTDLDGAINHCASECDGIYCLFDGA